MKRPFDSWEDTFRALGYRKTRIKRKNRRPASSNKMDGAGFFVETLEPRVMLAGDGLSVIEVIEVPELDGDRFYPKLFGRVEGAAEFGATANASDFESVANIQIEYFVEQVDESPEGIVTTDAFGRFEIEPTGLDYEFNDILIRTVDGIETLSYGDVWSEEVYLTYPNLPEISDVEVSVDAQTGDLTAPTIDGNLVEYPANGLDVDSVLVEFSTLDPTTGVQTTLGTAVPSVDGSFSFVASGLEPEVDTLSAEVVYFDSQVGGVIVENGVVVDDVIDPANSSTAIVEFIDNTIYWGVEGEENVVVTSLHVVGGQFGVPVTVEVKIVDDPSEDNWATHPTQGDDVDYVYDGIFSSEFETFTLIPGSVTSIPIRASFFADGISEGTEEFQLEIDSVNGGEIGENYSFGGLIDDVRPLVNFTTSTFSGPENNELVAMTSLELSEPSSAWVAVYVGVNDISSTQNQDYVISGFLGDEKRYHFPPGVTEIDIPIRFYSDDAVEGTESFELEIREVFHATKGPTSIFTAEIEDAGASVEFTRSSFAATEDNDRQYLVTSLELSDSVDESVDVTVRVVDGSATQNTDFVVDEFDGAEKTFTFSTGNTEIPIYIDFPEDDFEGIENYSLEIVDVVGANKGPLDTFSGLIVDQVDDSNTQPTVEFSPTSASGVEGSNLMMNFVLSEPSDEIVQVVFETVDGTADFGDDYLIIENVVSFPRQTLFASVPVYLRPDDDQNEPAEFFQVRISDVVNAEPGVESEFEGWIRPFGTEPDGGDDNGGDDNGGDDGGNDDPPNPSGGTPSVNFVDTQMTRYEGQEMLVEVGLTQSSSLPVTVDLEFTDITATYEFDYEPDKISLTFEPYQQIASFTIDLNTDTDDEFAERFEVELVNPVNATIGRESEFDGWIEDVYTPPRAPFVEFASFSEAGAEGNLLTFEISLSETVEGQVTVDLVYEDVTTIPGSDYSDSVVTATIDSGALYTTVEVELLEDDAVENSEQFKIRIDDVTNAELGFSSRLEATGTILDTTDLADVYFDGFTGTAVEGSTVSVNLAMSEPRDEVVAVLLTPLADDAEVDVDYEISRNVVFFEPGETNVSFDVKILNDVILESLEDLSIEITNVINATPSDSDVISIAIEDATGEPIVTFVTDRITRDEGQDIVVGLELSRESTSTVIVQLDANGGSADLGSDYTVASQTVVFAPGDYYEEVVFQTITDDVDEGREQFFVDIASVENGVSFIEEKFVGTIAESGQLPSVSFKEFSETVDEGDSFEIVFELDKPSNESVFFTVDPKFEINSNGYAYPHLFFHDAPFELDHENNGIALEFAPGATELSLSVDALFNESFDDDESFYEFEEFYGKFKFEIVHATNALVGNTYFYETNVGYSPRSEHPTVSIKAPFKGNKVDNKVAEDIRVELSRQSDEFVVVDLEVTGGDAVEGVDFALSNKVVSFEPGERVKTVKVNYLQPNAENSDAKFELSIFDELLAVKGDEHYRLELGVRNEEVPIPEVSVSSPSVAWESNNSTRIEFLLDAPAEEAITVALTLSGDAEEGNDYILSDTQLTFEPGLVVEYLDLEIVNDGIDEIEDVNGDETQDAEILEIAYEIISGNATLSQDDSTILITDANDDDEPSVIFEPRSSIIEGTSRTFTVSLQRPLYEEVEIDLSTTGLSGPGFAEYGVDYDFSPQNIVFGVGETEKEIEFEFFANIDEHDGQPFDGNVPYEEFEIRTEVKHGGIQVDDIYWPGVIWEHVGQVELHASNTFAVDAGESTPSSLLPYDFGEFVVSRKTKENSPFFRTNLLPLEVQFEVDTTYQSTAVRGTDYVLALDREGTEVVIGNTVEIPEGKDHVVLYVLPIDDEIVEWDERITLNLSESFSTPYTYFTHFQNSVELIDHDGIIQHSSRNIDTESTGLVRSSIDAGISKNTITEGSYELDLGVAGGLYRNTSTGNLGIRHHVARKGATGQFVDSLLPVHALPNGDLTDPNTVFRHVVYQGNAPFEDQARSGHLVTYTSADNGSPLEEFRKRSFFTSTESYHSSNFGTDEQTWADDEFGKEWRIGQLDKLVPYDGTNLLETKQGLRAESGIALLRGDGTSASYATSISDGNYEIFSEPEVNPTGVEPEGFDHRSDPFAGEAQWKFDANGQELFQIFISYNASPHRFAEYTLRGASPVGNTSLATTFIDQSYSPGDTIVEGKAWRSLGWYRADALLEEVSVTARSWGSSSPSEFTVDSIMVVRSHDFSTPDGSVNTLEQKQTGLDLHEYEESDADLVLTQKDGSQYVFNSSGFLEGHFDRNQNQTRYRYEDVDFDGRRDELVKVTEQGGVTTEYEYSDGYLSQIHENLGAGSHDYLTTSLEINEDGELVRIQFPDPQHEDSFRLDYIFSYYLERTYLDYRASETEYRGAALINGWRSLNTVIGGGGAEWGTYRAPTGAIGDASNEGAAEQSTEVRTLAGGSQHDGIYQTDRFGLVIAKALPSTLADASQPVWNYERNRHGQITKVTSPAGGQGGLASSNSPDVFSSLDATETIYEYDDDYNLESIAHPDGTNETWFYSLDDHNALESYSDRVGRTIEYQGFDSVGNPEFMYEFDSLGNSGAYGTNGVARVTKFTYTEIPDEILDLPSGSIRETVEAFGSDDAVTTENVYYELEGQVGLLKQTTEAINSADPLDRKLTKYFYNGLRQLERIESPSPSDLFEFTETAFELDRLGRVMSVSTTVDDSDGALSNVKTSYKFDGVGNAVELVDAEGRTTSTRYDILGNPTHVFHPDVDFESESVDEKLRGLTTLNYYSSGRISRTVHAGGGETEVARDDRGNIVGTFSNSASTVFAKPNYESFETDELPIRFSDQLKKPIATRFKYDLFGNLIAVSNPEFALLNDSNDVDNEWIRSWDIENQNYATQHGYDEFGRRVVTIQPSASDSDDANAVLWTKTEYGYDPDGQLTSVTTTAADGSEAITEYEYDSFGRLFKETGPEGESNQRLTTEYKYDLRDNLTGTREESLVDSGLGLYAETTTEYDLLNRPTKTIGVEPGFGQDSLVTEYKYDNHAGLLSRVEQSRLSGLVRWTNYQYDSLGRVLESSSSSPEGTTPPVVTFGYDLVGNNTSTTTTFENALGGDVIQESTTEYDSFNRPWRTVGYTDENQRRPESFSIFDSSGNLVETGTLIDADNKTFDKTYSYYDALNRPYKSERLVDDNRITTETIYHENGLVAKTKDHLDQVTSYQYNDLLLPATIMRELDPNGLHIQDQDTNVATTKYEYYPSGEHSLTIENGRAISGHAYDVFGNVTAVYQEDAYAAEDLSLVNEDRKVSYTYDLKGNVTRVTNSAGGYTEFVYDDLGRVRKETLSEELASPKTYFYDAFGQVVEYQNRGSKFVGSEYVPESIHYVYDISGALQAEHWDGESNKEYDYDALGNVTLASNVNGTYTYEYYDNGSIKSETVAGLPGLDTAITTNYQHATTDDNFGWSIEDGGEGVLSQSVTKLTTSGQVDYVAFSGRELDSHFVDYSYIDTELAYLHFVDRLPDGSPDVAFTEGRQYHNGLVTNRWLRANDSVVASQYFKYDTSGRETYVNINGNITESEPGAFDRPDAVSSSVAKFGRGYEGRLDGEFAWVVDEDDYDDDGNVTKTERYINTDFEEVKTSSLGDVYLIEKNPTTNHTNTDYLITFDIESAFADAQAAGGVGLKGVVSEYYFYTSDTVSEWRAAGGSLNVFNVESESEKTISVSIPATQLLTGRRLGFKLFVVDQDGNALSTYSDGLVNYRVFERDRVQELSWNRASQLTQIDEKRTKVLGDGIQTTDIVYEFQYDVHDRLVGTTRTAPNGSGGESIAGQTSVYADGNRVLVYDSMVEYISNTDQIYEATQTLRREFYDATGTLIGVRQEAASNSLDEDFKWVIADHRGAARHVQQGNRLVEIPYFVGGRPESGASASGFNGYVFDSLSELYFKDGRVYSGDQGLFLSEDSGSVASGSNNLYQRQIDSPSGKIEPRYSGVNYFAQSPNYTAEAVGRLAGAGLQMAGGGLAFLAGVVTSGFGGGFVAAIGADDFQAGFRTWRSGEYVHTGRYQLAKQLHASDNVAFGLELATGLASPAAAGAVLARGGAVAKAVANSTKATRYAYNASSGSIKNVYRASANFGTDFHNAVKLSGRNPVFGSNLANFGNNLNQARKARLAPRSTLTFADDPLIDANVLIQASRGNPEAARFLNANRGLISYGRATRNEFLKAGSQAELTQLTRGYGVVFDDALNYRAVISEASAMRQAFRAADAGSGSARVLRLMDSRQLAISRLSGIDLVTNDLQLFKRASDLGVNVHFLDLFPSSNGLSRAAQRAANYVPNPVGF